MVDVVKSEIVVLCLQSRLHWVSSHVSVSAQYASSLELFRCKTINPFVLHMFSLHFFAIVVYGFLYNGLFDRFCNSQ